MATSSYSSFGNDGSMPQQVDARTAAIQNRLRAVQQSAYGGAHQAQPQHHFQQQAQPMHAGAPMQQRAPTPQAAPVPVGANAEDAEKKIADQVKVAEESNIITRHVVFDINGSCKQFDIRPMQSIHTQLGTNTFRSRTRHGGKGASATPEGDTRTVMLHSITLKELKHNADFPIALRFPNQKAAPGNYRNQMGERFAFIAGPAMGDTYTLQGERTLVKESPFFHSFWADSYDGYNAKNLKSKGLFANESDAHGKFYNVQLSHPVIGELARDDENKKLIQDMLSKSTLRDMIMLPRDLVDSTIALLASEIETSLPIADLSAFQTAVSPADCDWSSVQSHLQSTLGSPEAATAEVQKHVRVFGTLEVRFKHMSQK